MEPGLSNVSHHIALNDDQKLIFLADYDRIKSFYWGPDAGVSFARSYGMCTR